MSVHYQATEFDLPPDLFVVDASYADPGSGRIRAACINCSQRKVKCCGNIPCDTCLKGNKKCEGLKPSSRTRWEHRRKKNPTTFPLGVRGMGADPSKRLDNSVLSGAVPSMQDEDFSATLFGLQPPRIENMSLTRPALAARSDNTHLIAPTMPLGPTSSLTSTSLAESDIAQSMATSSFATLHDPTTDAISRLINWPNVDGSAHESGACPFILAAESLEHHARILRSMSRHGVAAGDQSNTVCGYSSQATTTAATSNSTSQQTMSEQYNADILSFLGLMPMDVNSQL